MINDLIFALLFSYFVIVPVFMFSLYHDLNQYFPECFQESFIEHVFNTNEKLNLFGNILFIFFKLGCTLPYLIIYYIFAIIVTIIYYIIKFLFYKKETKWKSQFSHIHIAQMD